MSIWLISIIIYLVMATLTAIPVACQFIKAPKPVKTPEDIEAHPDFSANAKAKIAGNYARIAGALGFWKHQAKKNRYLNSYVAWWVIPSSILVPTLTQATADITQPSATWLITIISTHAAISLVLVQRLKTETNFRAYREGESAFYDTFRKLMDRPHNFGNTEDEQLDSYFETIEKIRQNVREGELTNLANLAN